MILKKKMFFTLFFFFTAVIFYIKYNSNWNNLEVKNVVSEKKSSDEMIVHLGNHFSDNVDVVITYANMNEIIKNMNCFKFSNIHVRTKVDLITIFDLSILFSCFDIIYVIKNLKLLIIISVYKKPNTQEINECFLAINNNMKTKLNNLFSTNAFIFIFEENSYVHINNLKAVQKNVFIMGNLKKNIDKTLSFIGKKIDKKYFLKILEQGNEIKTPTAPTTIFPDLIKDKNIFGYVDKELNVIVVKQKPKGKLLATYGAIKNVFF